VHREQKSKEMKKMNFIRVVMLAAVLVALSILGCQKKETIAEPQPEPQVQTPPTYPYNSIRDEHNVPSQPSVTTETPPAPVPAEEPIATVQPGTGSHKDHKAKPKEKYAPEKKSTRTYTVRQGDTLQEISQKFYGTTKKWRRIYQANKSRIKDADKLTVGTKLDIP
jgi:nucleoid-associated protein YgaU